ncbi:MAG: hypothetical protein RLZZ242_1076 [Bacteroidota bacterium]
MRLFLLVVLLFNQVALAQIHFDASIGYTPNGGLTETRVAVFVNPKTAFTASAALFTDGNYYETFPRLGVTKLFRTKNKNWKLLTFGLHVVSSVGGEYKHAEVYKQGLIEFSPFLNVRAPILRLYRDCKCGTERGLTLELVGDANLDYPYVGIGFRNGFD